MGLPTSIKDLVIRDIKRHNLMLMNVGAMIGKVNKSIMELQTKFKTNEKKAQQAAQPLATIGEMLEFQRGTILGEMAHDGLPIFSESEDDTKLVLAVCKVYGIPPESVKTVKRHELEQYVDENSTKLHLFE